MSCHNAIVATIHATEENDSSLRKYLSEVEHEIGLEEQLALERAEHEKTRAALQEQTKASERITSERQIELALQAYPLSPKSAKTVVELVMKGDGGALELNAKAQLVEKFGPRRLPEFLQDYLKVNDHFLGTNEEGKKAGPPALDKRTMSAKAIADFIEKNGQAAFHALPSSKDPRKK
jgi:hypothetical protein